MLRTIGWSVICVLTALPAAAVEPAVTTHEQRARGRSAGQVRGEGPLMNKVIADGVERSGTFAQLVAALDRSDVIVYVQASYTLPPNVEAQLSFLGAAKNGPRFLRIQVRATADTNERLSLIGHELQHAVEVAHAADVRDEAGLERLYRRIGHSRRQSREYDTAAAREAGRRVMEELWVPRTRRADGDGSSLM